MAAHQPAVVKNLRPEMIDEPVKRFRLPCKQLTRQFDFRRSFQWWIPPTL
jgi:hypothetical protein